MLFATILGSAAAIVSLLLLSIAVPRLRVWPLPNDSGPAYRLRRAANRLSGMLAGSLSVAVLVLSVVERQTLPVSSPALTVAGAVIFAFGGALGLLGYFQLGPALSHDQAGPLVSSGPYRVSRNPQYVGSVAVLLGFSTALGSLQGLLAAVACSAWFLLAPFAEESWLRDKFGSSYSAYLASAPRYLGVRFRRRAA